MSTTYTSGAGDVQMLDGGAGDVDYFGTGAGDPWVLSEIAATGFLWPFGTWPPFSEPGRSRSRWMRELEFGIEGGEVLELYGGALWPEGDYVLHLQDRAGGLYPSTELGAYPAVFAETVIRPERAGRVLRFALPAAGLGVYSLRVATGSDEVLLADLLTMVPTQYGLIIDNMRKGVPLNVYRTFPAREE